MHPNPRPFASLPASLRGVRGPLAICGVLLVGAVLYTALTATTALRAIGTPFPTLLVDPFGNVSTLSLPSWGGPRISPSHAVIAVDGLQLGAHIRYGDMPTHRLQNILRSHHGTESALAHVLFRSKAADLLVQLPVRHMDGSTISFFYAMYALAAWFILYSGLLVLLISSKRSGGRAYAFFSVGTFVFMMTFFDYHSTARLVPAFAVSSVWVPVSFAALAYAFPAPPERHRGLFRGLLAVLFVVGVMWAAALAILPAFGVNTYPLRRPLPTSGASLILVLALSMILRIRGSTGHARDELVAAAWGLSLVPVLAALALLLSTILGSRVFHLIVPFIVLCIPLSIGYALIRYNLLATPYVMNRQVLIVPLLLSALITSLLVVLLAYSILPSVTRPTLLLAVVLGTGWLVAFVALGHRLLHAWIFPAAAHFRPTVEQLGDQLAVLRDKGALLESVTAIVQRSLPVGSVRVLDPRALAGWASLPDHASEQLAQGQRVYTQEGPHTRHVLLPMRSHRELLGVLILGPKRNGELYTTEDLALLETVASISALALHNLAVLDQNDEFRRIQVAATQDEKRLALGLLGAEISHEIRYPLNFFRFLLKRGAGGEPLDPQDIEIGREEVERLERMLETLRRVKLPEGQLAMVSLHGPLHRALDLLQEAVCEQRLRVSIEVTEGLTVLADPDSLLQLLANLLRNAAQAAGIDGSIGVRDRVQSGGVLLEVWDSGPGIPENIAACLFDPWVTMHQGGSGLGLGLAISLRIARSFGWGLTFHRESEQTCFRIQIPMNCVVEQVSPAAEAP